MIETDMVSFASRSAFPGVSPDARALLKKYPRPAPRYTSYPTANHFSDDLETLDVPDLLARDNPLSPTPATPLSLYFHLPFCQARCWFCGCTTLITTRQSAADDYLDDLEREIVLTQPFLDPRRSVTQLHLGGGTPTFFSGPQLLRLASLVQENFRLDPAAEISVEIDPRHLESPQLLALRLLGARRASLGVQDTCPEVQQAVHRVQPQALNRRAVTLLREAGFTSINVDLIYGLPRQTLATYERTLDDVLSLRPDRLSVFGYAHVPSLKPAQRILEQQENLPSLDERLALQSLAHHRLTEAGYVDIGLDHYARPEDELALAARSGALHRNFQGYSTRAGASLYGFGLSAISSTPEGYRQNHKDLFAYRNALAEGHLPVDRGHRLTSDDHFRRTVIMRLMCDRALDYTALSAETGRDVRIELADELANLNDLEADGVLVRYARGFRLTARGLPLLRTVALRFDARAAAQACHAAAV